jgi:hypothetical protein
MAAFWIRSPGRDLVCHFTMPGHDFWSAFERSDTQSFDVMGAGGQLSQVEISRDGTVKASRGNDDGEYVTFVLTEEILNSIYPNRGN